MVGGDARGTPVAATESLLPVRARLSFAWLADRLPPLGLCQIADITVDATGVFYNSRYHHGIEDWAVERWLVREEWIQVPPPDWFSRL
jgi:hypothetical protein